MSIQDLIQACKQKDRQAEKALFFRFAGKILSLCRRYVKDEHKAKDFMQECFIHVFDQIHKYDPKKGQFEAWLYRVSTNTILQLLRKSKKEISFVYLDNLPENRIDEEELIEKIPKEELIAAIRELPVGYRKVLNLFIFEGWTHLEIAAALGIKVSTSQSQLTRAKQFLKKSLEKKITQQYEKRSIRRKIG